METTHINIMVLFDNTFQSFKLLLKTLDNVLLSATDDVEDYTISVTAPENHELYQELENYSEIYGYDCLPMSEHSLLNLLSSFESDHDMTATAFRQYLRNSVDYTILFCNAEASGQYSRLIDVLKSEGLRFKSVNYIPKKIENIAD